MRAPRGLQDPGWLTPRSSGLIQRPQEGRAWSLVSFTPLPLSLSLIAPHHLLYKERGSN